MSVKRCFIFFVLLFSSILNAKIPEILISSPTNYETKQSESLFQIKGQCLNSDELKINSRSIHLSPQGHFNFQTVLENPNQFHFYTLHAKNKNTQFSEKTIKVFYNKTQMKQSNIRSKSKEKTINKNQKTKQSQLNILIPEKNTQFDQKKITLSGHSQGIEFLIVQNKRYKIHPSGHFQVPYTLTKENQSEDIIIKGFSQTGQEIEIKHPVFFKAPKPRIYFHKKPKKFVVNPELQFAGKSEFTDELWINQTKITLNPDGSFTHKEIIKKNKTPYIFTFKAIGKSGRVSQVESKHELLRAPKVKINLESPSTSFESKKSRVVFKGKVDNAEQLFLNHHEIEIDDNGYFETIYTLHQAYQEKQIVLKATNSYGGQDTLACQLIYIPPKPTLEIISHSPESYSRSHEVVIKGKVKHAFAVDINNTSVSVDEFGYFSHPIILKQPDKAHIITLTTYSDHEEEIQKKLKIIYNPYKNPILAIESPSDALQTTHDFIVFKGQAKNCKQLLINNIPITIQDNGRFSQQFELTEIGEHLFKIDAIGENNKVIEKEKRIHKIAKPSLKKTKKTSDKVLRLAENSHKAYLNKKVTLELQDIDIREALKLLAKKAQLNIVSDQSLQGKISVSLTDVSIKQAIELILSNQNLGYKLDDSTLIIGNEENLKKASFIETRIIALNNMETKDVLPLIEKQLAENESIDAIPMQRKLIIHAGSNKIDRLVTLINTMDEDRIPQIVLEAQILEISKTASKELGIEWIHSLGMNYSLNFSRSPAFQQENSNKTIESAINFLQEQGLAKILAKPRIQVIDQQSAEIFIGDQIPVPSQVSDTSGKTTQVYDFLNVGITLKLQPHINTRLEEIKIKIQPEISYQSKHAAVPTLKTRKVDTSVFVKDGQMVLIGGLFNTQNSENSKGLPFLGDLPMLKGLFGNSGSTQHESELMIAITPKIVYLDRDEGIKE